MCERSVDNPFKRIVEKLRAAASLLVITHARPDGDGLGSIAAMASAARAAGRAVNLLVPNKIPARYTFLFPNARPAAARDFPGLADAAELIVVVDTCAHAQLDGLVDEIHRRRAKTVVIDHHATEGSLGDLQWIDTSASAVGVMVGELLATLNWPVDVRTAEALLTATLTDTGWLRFANTDGRCLRAVAGWYECGVRLDSLYRRIYQNARPERLKLFGRVLDSLEMHGDERLAVMTICGEDFAATGARPDETENLINSALEIRTVEVVVLITEHAEGVRVSLRSREYVDVAAIAQSLGGGGHARASGVRLGEDIETAKDRLISVCEAALKAQA